MNHPRLFSKIDADRILKRAAEIEGSDDSGPLTVEEIRSIAGEAGFGPQAVDLAIAEAQQAASQDAHRPPVQRSGVVFTHLSTSRTVPVEVSSEELTQAVRLFQPYREGPAQVELEEHQITWQDRKGICFSVTSARGVTEIRVFMSQILFRRGRWMGWLKHAADRLETLVSLVAAKGPSETHLLPTVPKPRPSATRPAAEP